MAKAPVRGQAKTRLGQQVGHDVAAELAAACLLDTLDMCEAVFLGRRARHIALAGDLAEAARHRSLVGRLSGWTVHEQRGDGFAARLVQAHADVARATGVPVVQIGTDTPHLCPADLADVAGRVGEDNDAVLGPAEDGGWWALAVTQARFTRLLRLVEMSTERTYVDTFAALQAAGARVTTAATLRDVDTVEDAAHAALSAPETAFARRWSQVSVGVPR